MVVNREFARRISEPLATESDEHYIRLMSNVPADTAAAAPAAQDREAMLVARFRDRLECIIRSFRAGRHRTSETLSFNESLAAARQTLNPRARRKPARRRLDPAFELLVNARAIEIARRRDPDASFPIGEDIRAAGLELIVELGPRRGRPADGLLRVHMHALMALYAQTCGSPLRAGQTRNNVYNPGFRSDAGEAMLELFRQVDPAITMTQLVDIVLAAHASGAIEGKRFEDFFPLFYGAPDPATGVPIPAPGYRVDRFIPIAPIYSS